MEKATLDSRFSGFSAPRPLTTLDAASAGALLASAYPHRAHEPALWPTREPNVARWVVDAPAGDHAPAAYLALWPVQAMQHRMDLVVDAARRRRGLGTRLLEFLIARAREAGATSLQARPYAGATDAVRLLARTGFRETMRMTGLALDDVRGARVATIEELRESAARRGFRLSTLTDELARDADAWIKLSDVNQAARFGWPEPDPNPDGTPHPRETPDEFRRRSEATGLIPEGCFVAVDGDRFIGYSALTEMDPGRTQAGSGGTAVRPEDRNRGVATVLKACCVRWGQENGVARMATSSGNPAMIRVNEKFGFRRTYEEIRTVLRLWT